MQKITNEYYVLVSYIGDDAVYLTENYRFDTDIHNALKAKNRLTAKMIKCNIEARHTCFVDIVPIKITYEW